MCIRDRYRTYGNAPPQASRTKADIYFEHWRWIWLEGKPGCVAVLLFFTHRGTHRQRYKPPASEKLMHWSFHGQLVGFCFGELISARSSLNRSSCYSFSRKRPSLIPGCLFCSSNFLSKEDHYYVEFRHPATFCCILITITGISSIALRLKIYGASAQPILSTVIWLLDVVLVLLILQRSTPGLGLGQTVMLPKPCPRRRKLNN